MDKKNLVEGQKEFHEMGIDLNNWIKKLTDELINWLTLRLLVAWLGCWPPLKHGLFFRLSLLLASTHLLVLLMASVCHVHWRLPRPLRLLDHVHRDCLAWVKVVPWTVRCHARATTEIFKKSKFQTTVFYQFPCGQVPTTYGPTHGMSLWSSQSYFKRSIRLHRNILTQM